MSYGLNNFGFYLQFQPSQHTVGLFLAEGCMMWHEGGKDEGRPESALNFPDGVNFTDLETTHCFLKAKKF